MVIIGEVFGEDAFQMGFVQDNPARSLVQMAVVSSRYRLAADGVWWRCGGRTVVPMKSRKGHVCRRLIIELGTPQVGSLYGRATGSRVRCL